MALDRLTMQFCIKQCTDAVAHPDVLAGLSENAKGQSAMAESLANQLQAALEMDEAADAAANAGVADTNNAGSVV